MEAIADFDSVGAAAGEQAYRRIRSDIVFGKLAPGQRLTLDRLRAAYGVSISTLREILSRLLPESLVTAEGARGFQVAPCSEEGLREIAELRLLVEKTALAQSFAAADMDWEGRVVAAHHKLARMETGLLQGERADPQPWKRYDREFHQALVSNCGSQALLDLHGGLYDRYLRYQMVFGIFRGRIAADEHEVLLACALKQDAATAQAILTQHIEGCVEFAIKNRLLA